MGINVRCGSQSGGLLRRSVRQASLRISVHVLLICCQLPEAVVVIGCSASLCGFGIKQVVRWYMFQFACQVLCRYTKYLLRPDVVVEVPSATLNIQTCPVTAAYANGARNSKVDRKLTWKGDLHVALARQKLHKAGTEPYLAKAAGYIGITDYVVAYLLLALYLHLAFWIYEAGIDVDLTEELAILTVAQVVDLGLARERHGYILAQASEFVLCHSRAA